MHVTGQASYDARKLKLESAKSIRALKIAESKLSLTDLCLKEQRKSISSLIFIRWLDQAVYRMDGSRNNESLAAYERNFVMNKKPSLYEMLRIHESGDAPYQTHFVLENIEKYVSSWCHWM